MTGDYFSLGKIKDYMGILKVTNNIVNIIPLKNYDHSKSNVDDQILLGNLLVHDGKIIISDDLLGMVFTTADISTIKKNTLCQLCDKSGIPLQKQNVILLIEDLNNNKINNIYIKSSEDGKTVVQTKYHWKYINSVFDNNLLKMADPNMMAAKIPPALPMHASDLNPRTCMLVDEFDNVMIVVVEGREKLTGAFGADLFFLAKLCKEFGAKHAINLDGGGSSKLMWREKGFTTSEYVGQDSYTIGNAIIVKPL
jgi:exopolysaccharide biosynthesis protein